MSAANSGKVTVGIIMVTIMDSYQQSILTGIQQAAKDKKINLIIIQDRDPNTTLNSTDDSNHLFKRVNPETMDILIFFSAVLQNRLAKDDVQNYIDRFKNIPKISLGVNIPGVPSILINNSTGVETLVDHLVVDHQCRNIACLAGPQENEEARERLKGYKEGLKKHNMTFNPELVVYGNFAPGDGNTAVDQLLDVRHVDFDAVICVDDYSALEAMTSLQNKGKKVPEQIKITGFDNIENSEFSNPGITTIQQPLYEIGYTSIETAVEIHKGDPCPPDQYLELPLVTRGSCGCTNIYMFEDIKAEHYEDQLTDKEIAERVRTLIQTRVRPHTVNAALPQSSTDWISAILKLTLKYVETQNEAVFWDNLNKIAQRAYKSGKNGILCLRNLHSYFAELGQNPGIINLWNKISSYLIFAENRYRGREKLFRDHINHQLTGALTLPIAGSSRQSMIEELIRSMPVLGIEDMLIVLYEKESNTPSVLFSWLNNQQTLPHENSLEQNKITPEIWNSKINGGHYLFPIFSEKQNLGYIYTEVSDRTFAFYNELADKITKGLEGILLMEKIQLYTTHLEDEITRRTAQLRDANEKLKELSYHDHLSGLKNRRFLNEVVKPEAEQLSNFLQFHNTPNEKRLYSDSRSFGLFLLDIDHFKHINDTYGHESGDMLIQQLSQILNNLCRDKDDVIRMGGEEFLMILKDFDASTLTEKADSIRKTIEQFQFTLAGGQKIQKTSSIGCLTFPIIHAQPELITLEETIALIDHALYEAKERGRNRAVTIGFKNNVFNQKDFRNRILNHFEELISNDAFFTTIP